MRKKFTTEIVDGLHITGERYLGCLTQCHGINQGRGQAYFLRNTAVYPPHKLRDPVAGHQQNGQLIQGQRQ